MRRHHRRTAIFSLRPWSIVGLTNSVLQRSRRTGCRKAVVSKLPQAAGAIREVKGVLGACPVWVHRFAVVTAGATLVLIFAAALVTSTGSGLAVPDWPLSFGQVFPPMVGG